jgi:hypothetical protein
MDKSTAGHVAAPDEVERMMRNLCAYALSEPEPLQRYLDLTHQQVVFDGVVAALRAERGKALAELLEQAMPMEKVVDASGLGTPQLVKSLVTAAGREIPKPPAKPKRAKPEPSVDEILAKVPAGRRVLTADELKALGLGESKPVKRKARAK